MTVNKIHKVFYMFFLMVALLGCSADTTQIDGALKYNNLDETENLQVLEFFAFTCPHCYKLEPRVKQWQKVRPKIIAFKKVTVAFGSAAQTLYGKAFYIGELLGVQDQVSEALWQAIYQKNKVFANEDDLISFFIQLGHDENEVKKLLASDELEAKQDEALALAKKYNVSKTPSFVINGKYYTDVQLAGGTEPLFKQLNELARKHSSITGQ